MEVRLGRMNQWVRKKRKECIMEKVAFQKEIDNNMGKCC